MRLELPGLCLTDAPGGLEFWHDPWLVALSFLTATFASYVALDMAERRRLAEGGLRLFWHWAAAAAAGGGIWSMHFIAMLAFRAPIPVQYDPPGTVISLLVAVLGVSAGLHLAAGPRGDRPRLPAGRLLVGGLLVGLAVAAMHYVGMAAMRIPGRIGYVPELFAASLLVAVIASTTALWLFQRVASLPQRLLSALVMAVGICGLHFTGMAATIITVEPKELVPAANPILLAVGVAGITYALLLLALVAAVADRRFSGFVAREGGRLRDANRALEREIAARREAEAELKAARLLAEEANRAKGEFLALVSHELRTPLNAILGFAELVRADGGDAEHVGEILRAGQRLDRVIKDMLDFARSDIGSDLPEEWIDVQSLAAAVQRSNAPLAHAANVRIRIEPPSGKSVQIRGDERRLRRALHSLVTNAVKFSPAGGIVRVRAERERSGEAVLEVSDSGPGMDAAALERAMEPFGQGHSVLGRSHEGVGLGLPLAQRLVALHGGRMSIDSTPGQGTVARLILPPQRCREASPSPAFAQGAPRDANDPAASKDDAA